MTRAVLSLGSNLGDRAEHLRTGVRGLGEWILAVSGVYETPPWGEDDQPLYLNAAVIVADPDATAADWLQRAQELERIAGRVRDPERRFGPRTLDVDVVAVFAVDGTPIDQGNPELTLPHPRAHLRAFVLRPWIDIEPHGRLPGHGWLTDLLQSEPLRTDAAAIRARPDITLESP